MAFTTEKIPWSGRLTSVQPHIRLTRSFDQLSHTYQGYVLGVQGAIGEDQREFSVAIGEGAHAQHQLQVGDSVSGLGVAIADPRLETAELYRVSKLRVIQRGKDSLPSIAPWHGVPPDLPTYRERGHRRLATRAYDDKCRSCIWGCRMAVEMIIDHWNPSQVRYRTETFCYGPLSCPIYKSGPRRKVPGRKGMSWEEPDWVDEDATSHRGPDE
jgi:hypothetical protein